MNYFVRTIIFFVFVVCSFYYAWSEGDRIVSDDEYSKVSATIPATITRSIGYDHNAGNIVAVQAYMNVLDYSTQERFYEKLDSYLKEAKRKGFIKEGTIILFPEHIGTPLFLLGEKKDLYAANTLSSALNQIAIGNLIGYLKVTGKNAFSENNSGTILKMKAKEMKSVYENAFRKLASFYRVTIIAGSILLPEPEIDPNTNLLVIKNGKFFNASFIFLPEGKLYSKFLVKQNLAKTEKQIANSLQSENAFLEFKNIGVLLSNDSLYNSIYDEKVKNKEVLISPSILIEKDEIDWNDDDIYSKKENLDSSLTQAELWRKYSIFEKMKTNPSTRVIVQVFLLGKFFDINLEGESAGFIRYIATEGLDNKSPVILNVWF